MLSINQIKPYEETVPIFGKRVTVKTHYQTQILKKLKNGYSVLIFVCGHQRVGKSFCSLYHQYFFNRIFGTETEVKKMTLYDPEEIAKVNLNRTSYMVDESSHLLNRREWYKKTHRALAVILDTQQYQQFVLIMISPFASDIDTMITKHFDFLIRVDDRGKYKVFKLLKKFDAFDNKKASRLYFLDNCSLKLSSVPEKLWNEYLDFSIKQKEKIRKERSSTWDVEKYIMGDSD